MCHNEFGDLHSIEVLNVTVKAQQTVIAVHLHVFSSRIFDRQGTASASKRLFLTGTKTS